MTATAAASESSFPLERHDHENEAETTVAGAPELLVARERNPVTLISILLLAEMSWLGAIVYGFFLLAR